MPTGGYKTQLQFSEIEPDFGTMMMQLHEFATDVMPNGVTRFPTLTFRHRVTPRDSRIDDLHSEVMTGNREWEDSQFPIFVTANPKRQELTKFGIDEPRDLLAYFALPVLESAGLITQINARAVVAGKEVEITPATQDMGPLLFSVSVGDRIFFQGHSYEIRTVYEDQFFGNTQIPAYLVAACAKNRPNVGSDPTLTDVTDSWRDNPLNPAHDAY